MSWRRFILAIGLTCIVSGTAGPAPALAAADDGGFRALSGVDAAGFVLPEDVELVRSFRLEAYGLAYERYQQTFGNARVLGGQLTLYRDDAGDVTMVIGAHYPDIVPSNAVRLFEDDVLGIVERDIGRGGERTVELMIDPQTGQYFYWVETRRIASRWVHWIGAETGRVINKFDALAHLVDCTAAVAPCGFGVEYDDGDLGDVKDLAGLTTLSGSVHTLVSDDSPVRQETHDQGSTNRPFLGPIATDTDDLWVRLGDVSPAQPALVDAHYYARVADDYFLTKHGFDWVQAFNDVNPNDSPNKRIVIQAHFFKSYNNAFWSGSYLAFGDGDGKSFREFTSLDVVGHELTHGTTEFTSNLVYQDESGALNESFSDIMGNSMEFYAAAGLETAAVDPDWYVGEDFDLRGDTVAGIRNMEDPEEDGDPDDYSERQVGGGDNGGVHTNSGIPNHAYYLLVNGGLNASCAAPATHNSAHCTGGVGDVGSPVAGVGLADAERIFFLGFIGLQSNATMCDARDATVAAASSLPKADSTSDAWEAVGVVSGGCGSGGGDTGGGGTGSIRGGVTGNGTNLPDALVTVNEASLTGLTNRGGKYKIDGVPADTYSVTASAAGCSQQTVQNVTVQDGVTLTVDFALTCL